MREFVSNTKRKEDDLIKKEKLIKEREADIERKLKEIEEKEKMLNDLEEQLLMRQ